MLGRRKSRAHPCEDAPSSVGRQLLAKAGYRQCAWTGAKHTLDRRQIAQRIDIDVIQQDDCASGIRFNGVATVS
jgi:hypothetical protein